MTNKKNSRFGFKVRSKQFIKSKRSQMKIQQMAFMLMAVFIFFILAGLFWLSIEYVQIHKQATQLEEERAIYAASFLASSAEFSCGAYCIDTDRLLVLKDVQAYDKYNFWPYAYIEIRKIGNEAEILCTRGSYPDCNYYNVYNQGKKSTAGPRSYVALCRRERFEDELYTKCELGFLIIGYEVK